jgi:hypothetical protein
LIGRTKVSVQETATEAGRQENACEDNRRGGEPQIVTHKHAGKTSIYTTAAVLGRGKGTVAVGLGGDFGAHSSMEPFPLGVP